MPLDKSGKDLSLEGCQYWFMIFQKLGLFQQSEFSHFCDVIGSAIFGNLDFSLNQIAYFVVKLLMYGILRSTPALV